MISLTSTLAQETAKKNIRVNSVAPGSIIFPGGGWERRMKEDPDGINAFVEANIACGRFGKPEEVADVVVFLASDRELAEEAWAGDIIGIPNHGQLRIGDTLTEGEAIRVSGIPSFAPELLQGVRAGDPMKSKHLEKALMQFAEEGAAKVFKPAIGSGFVVGVVGQLQFEVLASRIELEYGLPVRFEQSQFTSARWVNGDRQAVDKFTEANKQHIAHDHDGDIVYLTRLQWDIDRVDRDYPDVRLTATKEMMV